eukprot:2319033-Prorocentrum_lima.AAC.1
MIEEDVSHCVGPVHECTTNMTTMSYQYIALPVDVYVAILLDVDNSGWAPPSGKVFVGGLPPTFSLVADL